jgi:hypothetical protein
VDLDAPADLRIRSIVADAAPSTSSSAVRYESATKNTRPPGFRQSVTIDHNDANRSAGTCDSQIPKKTAGRLERVERIGPFAAGPARRAMHSGSRVIMTG